MKFIKSTLLLFTLALTLSQSMVQAKMLWLYPVQFINEFCDVVVLVNDLEHEHLRSHRLPVVKSVFVGVYNNIVTFFNEPSVATASALFIDFSSYILMPLEGGWQAPEAHSKFIEDPRAYANAGVTEDYLFKQSTSIFKEKYWMFFGLFQRVSTMVEEGVHSS